MSASSTFAAKYGKPTGANATGSVDASIPTTGSASQNFAAAIKAGAIKPVPVAQPTVTPPQPNIFNKLGALITTAFNNVDPKTQALIDVKANGPEVKIPDTINPVVENQQPTPVSEESAQLKPAVPVQQVQPVEATNTIAKINADKSVITTPSKQTFWSKLQTAFIGQPDPAQSAVDYNLQGAIAKKLNVSRDQVPMPTDKTRDQITKELGIRNQPNAEELTTDVMSLALIGGLIEAPLGTIASVGAFSAVQKGKEALVNKIKPGSKTFTDLLPDTLPDPLLRTIAGVELIAEFYLGNKVFQEVPAIKERLTKDIFTKNNIEPVVLTPEQVYNIRTTGKLTTAEQKDLFSQIGDKPGIQIGAVKEGITITPEQLLEVKDKPYWDKVKDVLGIKQRALTALKTNEPAIKTAQETFNTTVSKITAEVTAKNPGANPDEVGKMVGADSEIQYYAKELQKLQIENINLKDAAGISTERVKPLSFKIGGKNFNVEVQEGPPKAIGSGVETSPPVPETPVAPPEAPVVPPKKTFTKQEPVLTRDEVIGSKQELVDILVREKLAGNDMFTSKMMDRAKLSPDLARALDEAIVEADKKVAEVQGNVPTPETKVETKPVEEKTVVQQQSDEIKQANLDVQSAKVLRDKAPAMITEEQSANGVKDKKWYDEYIADTQRWIDTKVSAPKVEAVKPVETKITAKLPASIANAKPRYNYATKAFMPEFTSDVDKALYITAQKTPSKQDAQYRDFLIQNGFSNQEIIDGGTKVREYIKSQAAVLEGGTSVKPEVIKVEDQGILPVKQKPTSPMVPETTKTTPVVSKQVVKQAQTLKPKEIKAKQIQPEKVLSVLNKKAGKELPILKGFQVKDGKMTFTDLEHTVSLNTDKPDGYYTMVGKDAIKGADTTEFPERQQEETTPAFDILSGNLIEVVNKASSALSPDDTRPVLQGIRMSVKGGQLEIMSTDGFRVTYQTTGAKINSKDAEFVIAGNNLDKFINLLGEGKLEVKDSKTYVEFTGPNGSVQVGKIADQYPDIPRVYTSGFKNELVIDKTEFLDAVKQIEPYAKQNAKITKLLIDPEGGVKLIAEYKDMNGQTVTKSVDLKVSREEVNIPEGIIPGTLLMPVRVEGLADEPMPEIGLNYEFLRDAIKSVDGKEVRFDYNEPGDLKPVHFSDKVETPVKTVVPEVPKVKTVKKKAPSVPSGANASAGAETIGKFEQRPTKTEATNYKLYKNVELLIDKYAKLIGEGYLPKRAAGVYYTDTQNIRINGMNDLAVATHEISHFLDARFKISDRIREVVDTTEEGKPIYDPATKAVRKEITKLYTNYYPGGKKTDSVKKRTVEGLATLIQKYAEQPTTITQEYPNLVTEFLTENGKFYEPVIGQILKDVNKFIEDYQGLDPLDKIGARVTSDNVKYDKKSFMNVGDKARTQLADMVFPIEKLANISGQGMTINDPSLYIRQFQQISGIVATNLVGKTGYYRYVSGKGFTRTLDYNWKTLIDNLGKDKTTDSFGYYLVARASYFDYQLLNQYKVALDELMMQIEEAGGLEEAQKMISEDGTSLVEETNAAQKLYDEQNAMLVRDGITEKEASDAYLKNKDRFSKDELMFDKLTNESLKLLSEDEVGMLSKKQYQEFTEKQGYASRKRQFFDQLVGEEQQAAGPVKVGKSTVSSLLRRKGSKRTILNPVYSGIKNEAEIIRKAYRQVVYNKVNENLAPKFPDLAQPQQLIRSRQANGSFRYPQEKDTNIIMGRKNGKRLPVLWDNYVKTVLDETITPGNYGTFENVLLAVSRSFTKGTTGLFPAFAVTNWMGDQITLAANTTNNNIPLATAINTLSKALLSKDSPEAQYFLEYLVLGGQRQTFAHWQDMSATELSTKIRNERKGLLKVVDAINAGLDILSIPSTYSELSTRASEYIKSRQSGKPQIVALEEAGRVTAPFHHVGKWGGQFGRVAIKSLPFFNPNIQVMDQLLRVAGRDKKSRARLGFVFGAITAASIGAFALMMSSATDDQKRLLKDIEANELVNYIWLPNPDGKTLIKIKVQQYGLIGGIVSMALMNQMLDANYSTGDFISGAAQILPQQFDITDPVRALLAWIPPLIKVPMMTALNLKDYPKVLPLENTYLQSLPTGLRATESTSILAKKLGELTGLSPVKMDYLITGIFGRSSGFILGKGTAYNFFSGVTRSEYFTSGRTIQGYYDLKNQNDQAYKAMNDKITNPNQSESDKIKRLRQKTLMIDKYLNAYRDADMSKDTGRAADLRNEVVKRINELNSLNKEQTMVPKQPVFAFKLVKEAYAAAGLDEVNTDVQKESVSRAVELKQFFDKVKNFLPGTLGDNFINSVSNKYSGAVEDGKVNDKTREVYNNMLALREADWGWYKQNINPADEKSILGFDLTTPEDAKQLDARPQGKVLSATATPTTLPTQSPPTGVAGEGVGPSVEDNVTYKGLIQRKPDAAIDSIIKETTKDSQVTPTILSSLLWTENGYKPKGDGVNKDKQGNVKSTDIGIAQINDKSHPDVTRAQAEDPKFAIPFAKRQLEAGLKQFDGDWNKAIASYNRGRGTISKDPNDFKGQVYLWKVTQNMDEATKKELNIKNFTEKEVTKIKTYLGIK